MKIIKVITVVAIITGITFFVLNYKAGKVITYHRPCGGGRKHG